MDSIELFSGTGGLALGLKQAGFCHKALFEWDKNSCDNIRKNVDEGHPDVKKWSIIQSDVRSVRFERFADKIDLIAGGPPCQPFSLGGKHKAYNDCRDMFPEAVRAVRETRPKAFIFENVKGLLRKSFSSYFNYILLQLRYPFVIRKAPMTWEDHLAVLEKHHTSAIVEDVSYNVVFRLLNAADYGVPQVRQRVIIVGFRSDYNANWSFPNGNYSRDALLYSKWISGEYWDEHKLPIPKEIPLSCKQLKTIQASIEGNDKPLRRWRTVRDAIGDLPKPEKFSDSLIFQNHIYRSGARIYAGHSGSQLDEPSKTIKAGAHGVPGGENMVVLDNKRVRYYTVRESARIQTFPDDYLFVSPWTESMRQIGNAVPVKLAKAIGNSVMRQMRKIEKNDK